MSIFFKNAIIPYLSIGMMLLFVSCKKEEDEPLPACTDVNWEYGGVDGPDEWAKLCVDYTPCGGSMQSPIDLKAAVNDQALTAIAQTYVSTSTHIVNNGHTLEFNCDAGSSLSLAGDSYQLVQFHTHTHSEHTLNGVKLPMEMHFVHKNSATGKLAVIGVFVKAGVENATLKKIASKLPTAKNATFDDAALTFSASNFMPVNQSYFTYSGSLTTPPCSETVTWMVMEQAIEASADQIKSFETIEKVNARPIQPLGSRTIRYRKG